MLKLMADFAADYLGSAYDKQKSGEAYALPTDGQFEVVFRGFTEISDALDILKLSEELLRVAPPRSTRINRDHYLKFLVGGYLQEIYILEQRMTAYVAKISRLYKAPTLPSLVRRVVFEPLEGLILTRGAHVHQHRFSDAKLDMISTLSLFRRVGHKFGDDLEIEYRFVQREWSKRVKKNNDETQKLVDQFCKLVQVIICKDGKIVFPLSTASGSVSPASARLTPSSSGRLRRR